MRSKPQTESAKLLRRMYTTLLHAYGPQLWWPAQTPFEVIVGAFLTQSTSWRAVEKSIENLRRQGILNIEGLRAISEAELRDLIKPTGFMHRKASSLKAFIHFLDHEYDGSLARFSEQDTTKARRQLLDLPGVGARNGGRHPALCSGPPGHGCRRVSATARDAPSARP